jgi:NAD(P)H-hydrate epimerase
MTLARWFPKRLLHRLPDTHKGDYGHVLVVGGSVGMIGAPILCAQGALRSGAGRVSLIVPDRVYPMVASQAPWELMVHPVSRLEAIWEKADVVALGPGLSRLPYAQRLAHRLLQDLHGPAVVDADGLAALKRLSPKRLKYGVVITPHPGEMADLLQTSVSRIQADRRGIAQEVARRWGVVVVLKGHRTVVASPSGPCVVNPTGNPGMATAGMGDVLTGVIAALMGQGLDPFLAARVGVYLHGLAGDLAKAKLGEISLIASDLVDHLPDAFQRALA